MIQQRYCFISVWSGWRSSLYMVPAIMGMLHLNLGEMLSLSISGLLAKSIVANQLPFVACVFM